ncbi:MAG: YbjQ family protein [bacterium]
MILVNTDFITGREFVTLGLVKGSTIRSKHLGKDILAAFKTIVGGELTAYQEMIQEARAIATKRMVDDATEMQADAVINVRYATSSVTSNAAEVLAYGTAVKFL